MIIIIIKSLMIIILVLLILVITMIEINISLMIIVIILSIMTMIRLTTIMIEERQPEGRQGDRGDCFSKRELEYRIPRLPSPVELPEASPDFCRNETSFL